MDRSPSSRWMRTGVLMVWVGVAMFAACVATGVAHGPRVLSGTFLVLMVVCALVGFCFAAIGASKGRAENQRLLEQVRARTKRR
jgi:choline-glycine betaine transporter